MLGTALGSKLGTKLGTKLGAALATMHGTKLGIKLGMHFFENFPKQCLHWRGCGGFSYGRVAPVAGPSSPGARVFTLIFTVLGDSDYQKHIVKWSRVCSRIVKYNEQMLRFSQIASSGQPAQPAKQASQASQPGQPAKPASQDVTENHCLGSRARVMMITGRFV